MFVGFASVASYGQGSNKKVPNQLIFRQPVHDFGTLKRGEKRKHLFHFTNHSEKSVEILDAHAPCGCLVSGLTKTTYQPGESGHIEVVLNSSDHTGDLLKTVLLTTSEKVDGNRILTIKASIIDEIRAEPPLVDFGTVPIGSTPLQVIMIRPVNLEGPLQVHQLQYDRKKLAVELVQEGANWRLQVKLRPSVATGLMRESIMVINNSPSLKSLQVPVLADIRGHVVHKPEYLDFGYVAPSGEVKRQLHLKSTVPFTIKKAVVDILLNGESVDNVKDLIDFKVENEHSKTLDKRVMISLKNKLLLEKGAIHGQIRFNTDRKEERLVVDLYALFVNDNKD